jgi:hypothetical protein
MRRNVRILGTIIIVIMVAGFAEFMAYVKSRHLVKYSIGFTPLDITESYESYSGRHHPRLGWLPSPANLDVEGSLPIPAFPDPTRNRDYVSLYGESFTQGAGVDPEHAWSNVLSLLLNRRVANFGVSGFGTDQAYLRFLDNREDPADIVILGFLSENVIRNVNQLRNMISTPTSCFIKPRFILDEREQLTLVPIPSLTKREYSTLRENPGAVLPHEYFLPGGISGYQRMQFPYTWGIIKAFPIIYRTLLLHRPTFFDFYQPGHPSKAVDVTVGIMEEFSREARKRGKQPLILIIPTHFDILEYRHSGKWVYQPLIDLLTKKNLAFIDAGPRLSQYLADAGVETLYSPATQNHLNGKGNEVLARIVYDYLSQHKLQPRENKAKN